MPPVQIPGNPSSEPKVTVAGLKKNNLPLSHPKEPVRKKMKQSLSPTQSLLQTLQLTLRGEPSLTVRDLEGFIKGIHHDDPEIRWLAVECVSVLLKISEESKQSLKAASRISAKEDVVIGMKFQRNIDKMLSSVPEHSVELSAFSEMLLQTQSAKANSNAISVRKLKIQSRSNSPHSGSFVLLHSHVQILQKLFHLLSSQSWSPICLYGPTGSGKSAMLKLLASVFTRYEYPDVISVQMSDQIDSHLLLGSYHSTDIPGQFVWRPGCLTKAVIHGHWIIIEDLDSAPVDVLTLLDSIIESQTLSVPGYGFINKFHRGFRLLSTCRVIDSQHESVVMDKVSRHWKKIKIEGMKSNELKIMLVSMFPHLKNMADKLIALLTSTEEEFRKPGTRNRVLSLRDLLKLCRRIPENMDFTKPTAATRIFQECVDVFVSSLHNSDLKKEVASKIGGLLNILVTSTSFLLGGYKPLTRIDSYAQSLSIGRYSLPIYTRTYYKSGPSTVFSLTKQACCLLERMCGSIQFGEPILLIGETGVGKTSCIQFLARSLGQKLVVVNLNRQSDSSELIGGYKPVELKYILGPIREEFEILFGLTFNCDTNRKFLNHVMSCYSSRQWKALIRLLMHTIKSAVSRQHIFVDKPEILQRWMDLNIKLSRISAQVDQLEESPFAFSFIEGALIDAVRNGYWILVDEINLATSEMLQCLSGVLESDSQIHLWEKGTEEPIERHNKFRFFAAMNPSTDVGKTDLPIGLRNRFTEYVVDELEDADELQVLVADYLAEMSILPDQVKSIVFFYMNIKKKTQSDLVDGTGKRPYFSLRTLCRALKIASYKLFGGVSRSLYESFCISFLTQINSSSRAVVETLIRKYVLANQNSRALLNQPIPQPTTGNYIFVEGYWIPKGDLDEVLPTKYILTPTIHRNLRDIARIVSAGKLPVLIQGETSVGKTSLIQYLAKVSGNRCFRINNHQHTDLQEYIGTYQSDASGKLVFAEGVLVQAMRSGDWVILDELNLAPSEVLEALNRLLDDNRQLFIAETGITVTAHPRFTLFATQNPPGLYGGRKILSRAFRNRFVELHFDEIPSIELETILHKRCDIPVTYCKKIICVLKDLQMQRKSSAALQGKHGFATLRDLFRWAERYRLSDPQKTKFYDWDQHLADEGFLVLAGKVRNDSEASIILKTLSKHFKRTVDPENLFSLHDKTSSTTRTILESILNCQNDEFKHIVWTRQMRRLAVLIYNAMKFKEPVLLVGETGGGKTTAVQLIAYLLKRELFAINCHMHSEGSDFLGGLRPRRCREEADGPLFEWVDGALVKAMQEGGLFLADEISLADDSVLERINSVLEPERTLLISEKGDANPELITAHDNFLFVGTMNPGGDFGKKELSPALRNRLTEIWCPVSTEDSDLISIIECALNPSLKLRGIGEVMISFCKWFKGQTLFSKLIVSIRDYLSWVNFVNYTVLQGKLSVSLAIWHGACMVFVDSLGMQSSAAENFDLVQTSKEEAFKTLCRLLSSSGESTLALSVQDMNLDCSLTDSENDFSIGQFSILKRESAKPIPASKETSGFNFKAPTTCENAVRILRAMQLSKPILLEGSPGVGKTALVKALANLTQNSVTRINMSEQTDISDLFGADLPVEGETGGHFAWRDGPLLQAIQNGSWILLDELNLASQSVLEGLNACLDHRGEIYVPELNRSFKVRVGCTRIFACQNPMTQGGARKGLPKSFLNRFTQVFIQPLSSNDKYFVLSASFPSFSPEATALMTNFSELLYDSVCAKALFGSQGSPWDFNLRDLLRWAQLVEADSLKCLDEFGKEKLSPDVFVDLVYGLRMRSQEDRIKVSKLFSLANNIELPISHRTHLQTLDVPSDRLPFMCGQSQLLILEDKIVCGIGELNRSSTGFSSLKNFSYPTSRQLPALEGLLTCLKMNWMPILVGNTGAGKTYLIKTVSRLCGKELHVLTPHPEMDTMELLGGFEQDDVYRRVSEAKIHIEDFMRKVASLTILSSTSSSTSTSNNDSIGSLERRKEWIDFFNQWAFLTSLGHLSPSDDSSPQNQIDDKIRERVDLMRVCFFACKTLLDLSGPPNGEESTSNLSELQVECDQVAQELQAIDRNLKTGFHSGGFHWIHGVLVKAMIKGDWVLIDGANRCTAAVLDRLNSLVEPDGSLFLTERGSIEGEIIELRPHPEFRLILAMNPCYGEISRAMRNRGVEIYIPGTDDAAVDNSASLNLRDELPGIPSSFLSSSWCRMWKSLQIFKTSQLYGHNIEHEGRPLVPLSLNPSVDFSSIALLALFSHALNSDRELLGKIVSEKFPEMSGLCSLLARDIPFDRDFQWEPQFTAKFKIEEPLPSNLASYCSTVAKFSLRDYSYYLCDEAKFLPGSLGLICMQAAQGDISIPNMPQKSMELLSASWSSFSALKSFIAILVNNDEDGTNWSILSLLESKSSLSLKDIADFWRKGINILLCLQRMCIFYNVKFESKANNETIFTKLKVLLSWVEEAISDLLKITRFNPVDATVLQLLDYTNKVRCFLLDGRDEEVILAEELVREHCLVAEPLSLQGDAEKITFTSSALRSVSRIWSRISCQQRKNWLTVLTSEHAKSLYSEICRLFSTVVTPSDDSDDEYLLRTLAQFEQIFWDTTDTSLHTLKDFSTETSMECEKTCQFNFCGLTELLHILDQSKSSTAFTHPWLNFLYQQNHQPCDNTPDAFGLYMQWEAKRNFVSTFTDLPLGSAETSCLVPYFTSKIILDPESGLRNMKSSTVSASARVEATFGQLLNIFSSQATTEEFNFSSNKFIADAIQTFKSNADALLNVLQQGNVREIIAQAVQKLDEIENEMNIDNLSKQVIIGQLLIKVAGTLIQVLSEIPFVDPALKKRIQGEYLEQYVEVFSSWQSSHLLYQEAAVGNGVLPHLRHPYCTAVSTYLDQAQGVLEELKKNRADRPVVPQYDAILLDLKQFAKSFGSSVRLQQMSEDLSSAFFNTETSERAIQDLMTRCESWIVGHSNFAANLASQFWYLDIVGPSLYVSSWASTGLMLLADAVKQKFGRPCELMLKSIEALVAFPVDPDIEVPIHFLQSELSLSTRLTKGLFMAAFMTLANQVETKGSLDKQSASQWFCLSQLATEAWIKQEDKMRADKEERDAFYVHKGKERTMDLPEADHEAGQPNDMFPNFDSDFVDLKETEGISSPAQELHETVYYWDANDVNRFADLHSRLCNFVSSQWLESKLMDASTSTDFVSPFIYRFQVGCLSFDKHAESLGQDDTKKFIVGTSFALSKLCDSPGDPVNPTGNQDIYDIYRDPSPIEVKKLEIVLQEVRNRVIELLLQWPEHPSLQKIITVIDRLESFAVNSPLMKFVQGLELLYEISQEWERNAHSGVSLSLVLAKVRELILSWRKMEFSGWKNLLEINYRRKQQDAFKWWFHLISATMEVITSSDVSTQQLDDLLRTLQQFIESAPLCQYEKRIHMLYEIHSFLIALETCQVPGLEIRRVHPVFWNSIKFYEEFRTAVSKHFAKLKLPIETKIKDFVKICRWNDASFPALKDSIQRSHNTLRKFLKEFDSLLALPVKSLLVSDCNLPKLNKFQLRQDDQRQWFLLNPQVEYSVMDDDSVVSKTGEMADTFVQMGTVNLNTTLTSFNDVLESTVGSIKDMESYEVEETGPKRKAQLHHVHSRRRLALADLFKDLSKLSLSYRRGMVRYQNVLLHVKSDGPDATLTRNISTFFNYFRDPHDLSAGWKQLRKLSCDQTFQFSDEYVIKLWSSGTESGFQQCIIRLLALMTAFDTPNKQLSVAIIERCKGFAFDLMDRILVEKALIASFSQSVWLLRSVRANGVPKLEAKSLENLVQIITEKVATVVFEFNQWKLYVSGALKNDHHLKAELTIFVDYVLQQCEQVKLQLRSFSDIATSSRQVLQSTIDILRGTVDVFQKSELCTSHSVVCEFLRVSINNLNTFVLECSSVATEIPMDSSPAGSSLGIATAPVSERCASLVAHITSAFNDLQAQHLNHSNEPQLSELISVLKLNTLIKDFESITSERSGSQEELNHLWSRVKPLLDQYLLVCQFYLVDLLEVHRGRCQLLSTLCCLFIALGQKGFNLPPDYEDEAMKEGSELDAKGGMGLGDGEISSDAKDISDRIESEDQLEETLKPGQSSEPANKDVEDNTDGVEMSEDFDGKMQDLAKDKKDSSNQENKDDDSEQEEDGQDVDEQMGDVDDSTTKPEDEQNFGGSSDEEDENLKEEPSAKGQQETESGAQADADENTPKLDDETEHSESAENKEQQQKKAFEDDAEQDDDQANNMHGECAPEVEPEALDLPDDLNLDDAGGVADKEDQVDNGEEDPFDLDKETREEKTDMNSLDEGEEEGPEEIGEKEINPEDISGDEPADDDNLKVESVRDDQNISEEVPEDDKDEASAAQEKALDEGKKDENVPEDEDMTSQLQSDNAGAQENAEVDSAVRDEANFSRNESMMDTEVTEPNSTGDPDPGHNQQSDCMGSDGNRAASLDAPTVDTEMDTSEEKSGAMDTKRTLDDTTTASDTKRLKTIDRGDAVDIQAEQPEETENPENSERTAELYEHTSAGEKHDNITTEDASLEDVKAQQHNSTPTTNETEKQPMEVDPEVDADDVVEKVTAEELKSQREREDHTKPKKSDSKEDSVEDNDSVEFLGGEVIPSQNISRPDMTSFYTRSELLVNSNLTHKMDSSDSATNSQEGSKLNDPEDSLMAEALTRWHELEGWTLPLAHELCEQLRLILEPTISARLKGDYKTGKRINMRKIIPYIASGYRKDKIWLRRTQPSKRDYQILLALDDSASMSDNHSKTMAFSAVAVVAKSLGLLEAGQLSVVSFGENVNLVHSFDEPFTDMSGARILEGLKFKQRQTRIAQLMDYVGTTFSRQKDRQVSMPDLAQLLIIVSDGRNVSSEGQEAVAKAIRRVTDANIFIVFIIVDNPSNKVSVLDIRYAEFDEKQNLKQINNYLDNFPFPFYIVLRDLNSLPSIMADALRQWFELVTSSERQ